MHDSKGRELKAGDRVILLATVKELYRDGEKHYEDYCNVSLTSELGRRPDGEKEVLGGFNTGILLRNNEGDENDIGGVL